MLHGAVMLMVRRLPVAHRLHVSVSYLLRMRYFGLCERTLCCLCSSRWLYIDGSVQYGSRASSLELIMILPSQPGGLADDIGP